MTDTSPITQDPVTNQFLPGNIWRYKPGISGRVARYSYRSITAHIKDYWETCEQTEKRYTWAGLAVHMGCTRQALDGYRQKTIQSADAPKIAGILAYYASCIEAQLEERLTDRLFSTAGVIRGLQALDPEKWGDNKKIEVDIKQQISIAIDPDSALGKRLNSAGVTIDQPTDVLEQS